ncbi:MAG: prepilin-type N-terminal cleavage/methylation domain-containing protein [bacterium]|jgi:prepilin-type N-terminal cleavage/methylation domain-containing protein|nr:prepilin-type N-terminal cleavage/methylation domain-containing protein [bacterium]
MNAKSLLPHRLAQGSGFGAFTIVELLVVVSILGIISTLTVPVARDALLRARITAVQGNMVQIAKAVDAFAVDRGYYPHGSDQPPTQFLTNYDALTALAPLMGTYLPNDPAILSDAFTQKAVQEINESIAFDPGIPDLFGYGYYDYVHFMVPPNKARYAYSLISFGPDGEDSSLGLLPLPGIGDRLYDAPYNPSNGLQSTGDLGCFGGNSGMPRLIPSY